MTSEINALIKCRVGDPFILREIRYHCPIYCIVSTLSYMSIMTSVFVRFSISWYWCIDWSNKWLVPFNIYITEYFLISRKKTSYLHPNVIPWTSHMGWTRFSLCIWSLITIAEHLACQMIHIYILTCSVSSELLVLLKCIGNSGMIPCAMACLVFWN